MFCSGVQKSKPYLVHISVCLKYFLFTDNTSKPCAAVVHSICTLIKLTTTFKYSNKLCRTCAKVCSPVIILRSRSSIKTHKGDSPTKRRIKADSS